MGGGREREREREIEKESKEEVPLRSLTSFTFHPLLLRQTLSQLTVPRLGYLPSVADRALDAFRNVLSPLALVNPRAASGSGAEGEGGKTSTAAEAGAGASSPSSSLPCSSSSSSSSSPAPWFSETGDPLGTPLRWHFPVGVLADAAVARKGKRGSGRGGGGGNNGGGDGRSSPSSPPWPLTIHFSRYPASVLPPWRVASIAAAEGGGGGGGEAGKRASPSSVSSLALREAFFNSLKEASCAATGTAARVLAMPGVAAERLWAAAEAGDAEAASAAVSRVLRGPGEWERGAGTGAEEAGGALPSSSGSVPLRLVVVAPAAGESLRDPHCAFETVCTSRPVAKISCRGGGGGEGGGRGKEGEARSAEEPAAAAAATTTLGQALLEALPRLQGGGPGTPSASWTLGSLSSSAESGLLLRGKGARVLIAGLEVAAAAAGAAAGAAGSSSDEGSPPLHLLAAPLPWVHARLSACDQFLYVVVRAPEPL